jgi:2-aminobenzoate-CoA ligase
MIKSGLIDTFARQNLPKKSLQPEFNFSIDTQYPSRINAANELLNGAINDGGGALIALRSDDASCTYDQLQAQVNRLCHVLIDDLRLTTGNRVLLRGANTPMMAACWLAVVKCGLIAVATMPLLRAKELGQVIEKAQVHAALCDFKLAQELQAAQTLYPSLSKVLFFSCGSTEAKHQNLDQLALNKPTDFKACDTASDDVALIAFTSGTTGQPKGTMHFHRDVLAMCDLFPRHVLKPNGDDIFCGTPPLAFTFGLGGMLAFPMRAQASTVLLEGLTPEKLLTAIAHHRATICFTAPTFYRQMAILLQAHPGKFDLSALRKCVSAGEALPDTTRTLWHKTTGLDMIDGIGATEMIHIFISSAGPEIKPGAVGKVVPGYEAKVVDERMKELPRGTIGRLAVKGATGCRYLADERQRNYVRDGWNLTGDMFLQDSEGYFVYQARSDDMIISAGYNIAGPEVEACLMQHPWVSECAVVGVADEDRGQIVKAFIVLKPGQEPTQPAIEALQTFVKNSIAPYKYPRAIEFLDTLPRTETGKLQRFKLKE